MKKLKKNLSLLMAISFITGVWGCVDPSTSAIGTAVAQAKSIPEQTTTAKNPYQQKVVELTTLDCAKCHIQIFSTIRDHGGKHQLECRFCHESFHNYRPWLAWKEVVPNCESCHGEIHGPAFKDCLSCHGNAHAPIAGLTNMTTLEKECSNCHSKQAAEVVKFPSSHTKVSCSDCHHSQHGYRPDCTECHEVPHTEFKDNSSCTGCHAVHKPLEIQLKKETPNSACAGCHEQTTLRLVSTAKKHATLQCVYCHSETHGNVPDCQQCHPTPHSKGMLDKFDGCLACHGDPHALLLPGH